jgi:hypothetical protein
VPRGIGSADGESQFVDLKRSPPAGQSKLLCPWPDPPTPLLLTWEVEKSSSARWSTIVSSKVNLPRAIDFRASYGANDVTYPADVRGVETFEPTGWKRKVPNGPER